MHRNRIASDEIKVHCTAKIEYVASKIADGALSSPRQHSRARASSPLLLLLTPLAPWLDRSTDCSRVSSSILDPTSVATPPRASETASSSTMPSSRMRSPSRMSRSRMSSTAVDSRGRRRTPSPPRARSSRTPFAGTSPVIDDTLVSSRNPRESCAVGVNAP